MYFRIVPSRHPDAGPSRLRVRLGQSLKARLAAVFARLAAKRLDKMASGDFAPSWKLLNNRLTEKMALPYLMVTAPRWNTHACIMTAGPFAHPGGPVRFAGIGEKVWALVVYDAATAETVGFFSSGTATRAIDLPQGVYGAGLRIYQATGKVDIPDLFAGAVALVPGARLDADDMRPLEQTIFGKDSLFYRLLNAPAQASLCAVTDPKDSKVAKAYLPVGNPETLFIFGALRRGDVLTIDAGASAADALLCLTTYNIASFPVTSVALPDTGSSGTAPAAVDGSFLLRIVPRRGSAQDHRALLDTVTVRASA